MRGYRREVHKMRVIRSIPPNAVAGEDQSISLPSSSVTVDGSGSSDPDGTIVSYLWEYISGPSGSTIQNPNNVSTDITGLVEGNYDFRLTVTDNDSLTDTDIISISVVEEEFLYDGVVEVDDCLDQDGQNTLVDGTGSSIGDTVVLQGTSTPFNGNNNFYRLTLGGANQFYPNFTGLIISNFTVQIDSSGEIIDKIYCS